jgi:hypothetical protein
VVEGAHGVEQVRRGLRARVDPGRGLLVARVRVPDRGDDAALVSIAPGSSGAIVTIFTAPFPASMSSVSSARSGSRSTSARWAPHLAAEM